jgi:hypothetical protein
LFSLINVCSKKINIVIKCIHLWCFYVKNNKRIIFALWKSKYKSDNKVTFQWFNFKVIDHSAIIYSSNSEINRINQWNANLEKVNRTSLFQNANFYYSTQKGSVIAFIQTPSRKSLGFNSFINFLVTPFFKYSLRLRLIKLMTNKAFINLVE